ncbi:hypothetical protein WOA01_18730 [Methylocystis sp. IM2]|uniref:hypothetical protein n=1 Tax=Methylocystis sp. IM2 TaxID=3136563 RepID=UPI0030FAC218
MLKPSTSLKALTAIFMMYTNCASADPMPKADTLPDFTVSCRQETSVGWGNITSADMALNGNHKDDVSYAIRSINKRTLKVIENPDNTELRKEYAKYAAEINVDYGRNALIFGWKEGGNTMCCMLRMGYCW